MSPSKSSIVGRGNHSPSTGTSRKYQGLKDVISKQKNVSILNYISMYYAKSPSKSIFESVMKTINDERFRDAFKQYKEDDLDKDDEIPRRSNKKVAFDLCSHTITTLQEYPLPESSPRKRSLDDVKKIFQNLLDAAEDLRYIDKSRLEHELGHFYKFTESFEA